MKEKEKGNGMEEKEEKMEENLFFHVGSKARDPNFA